MRGPVVRRWEAKVLRADFDEWLATFRARALPGMQAVEGFLSISIQAEQTENPSRVTVLTKWEDEAAIQRYAGDDAARAVVPDFMDRFLVEYDPVATFHDELLLEIN